MPRRAWGLRYNLLLTPVGLLVALGGGYLIAAVGEERMDRVVAAAGMVAFGVLGLSVGSVIVASIRLWVHAHRHPTTNPLSLQTGGTVATGLSLPWVGWWPLVELTVIWEEPEEVEVTLRRLGGRSQELITPASRGETERVARRFVVRDIFGFAQLGLRVVQPQPVRVVPPAARVTAHVQSRFLDGDALSHPQGAAAGDLIEMRRYVQGDPLRWILWKAFARTRKLLVRTPEVAINPQPSAAGYLVAGPGDEPTASAARFFVEGGLLGDDFVFGADGTQTLARSAAEALDLIIKSAGSRAHGGDGLSRFLENLDHNRRGNCVLFVPPVPGRWLARVEQAGRRLPGARVVSAIDNRPGASAPGRLRRLLFSRTDSEPQGQRDMARVIKRLSDAGFEVLVLHRPSGEVLSRAQLDTLVKVAS